LSAELVINLKNAHGPEPKYPANDAYSGRRSARIAALFAAAQNVCFWHKADIATVALLVTSAAGDNGEGLDRLTPADARIRPQLQRNSLRARRHQGFRLLRWPAQAVTPKKVNS
jgi:hypothetical protein